MKSKAKLDYNRLLIFHEARKRRIFVGELVYLKDEDQYELIYDKDYAHSKKAIPIGPELDLFSLRHKSSKGKLFPSFTDRIPLKTNPAYIDYCKSQGVDPDEANPIILLISIGKRGPSSFIFESAYKNEFSIDDVVQLQNQLNITRYDFAEAFDFNILTLQKLESGKSQDKNTLKRLQIYLEFPEVALWQLKQTGVRINHNSYSKLINYFKSQTKDLNQLSEVILFNEALSYAKDNNISSLQNLLKNTRNRIFENLKILRQSYENSIDADNLNLIMDKFINTASPLFQILFAAYLVLNKKIFNSLLSQFLFDLLEIDDWKKQGGLMKIHHIPELLVYVCHYLLGTLSINNHDLENIIIISKIKLPIYTEHGHYKYLYENRSLTGWVESLDRDCFKSFQFLFDAYNRWSWLKFLFANELDFKKSLVCYQTTIIMLNYFDAVHTNCLETMNLYNTCCNIPPSSAIADNEIKRYANHYLIENREFFNQYLVEKNISKEKVINQWELWLKEMGKFRYQHFSIWLFENTLIKNIID